MANKSDPNGKVIIKKYANRRLYDTSTSSYVTLDHLAELVRREVDFEVRDAKSGDDLTHQVLTQIIFERETKGEGALPLSFLRQLIGFYGGGAQSMLPAWLDMSMNSFAESQERWRKTVGGVGVGVGPISLFEAQARRNMEMFESAMRMFMPGKGGPTPAAPAAFGDVETVKPTEDPSKDQTISTLKSQMEAMQRQIDKLATK